MVNRKIMIVAAHADDNEIMAGGTMRKYHDLGYEIVYVMSTNNMSGGNSVLKPDGKVETSVDGTVITMERRKRECDAAAALVGAKPIHLDHPQRHYKDEKTGEKPELRYGCALPEGVGENVPSILTAYEDKKSLQVVIDLIMEHKPECLFTVGMASGNIEHLGTALLVVKAYWKAVEQGHKGALLQGREDYTSFGELNTKWETYIDISDYLDKKIEMIGKHSSQMPTVHYPDHGHRLRPLKWGVACGCKAAEVFTWVNRANCPDMDSTLGGTSPLLTELTQNTR